MKIDEILIEFPKFAFLLWLQIPTAPYTRPLFGSVTLDDQDLGDTKQDSHTRPCPSRMLSWSMENHGKMMGKSWKQVSHVLNVLRALAQIRKCLRHCLRFAYAHVLFTPHPYKEPFPDHERRGLERGSNGFSACFKLTRWEIPHLVTVGLNKTRPLLRWKRSHSPIFWT